MDSRKSLISSGNLTRSPKVVELEEDSLSDIEDEFLDKYMYQIVLDFEKKNSWGIFNSDSLLHVIWDFTLFICIIYLIIVIPYRISFESDAKGFLYYLEMIIDAIFIIDIFVCLNSSFI